MRRSATKSVKKLRAKSRRPQESEVTGRLAAVSARIDAARNASYVRRPVFGRSLEVVAYELLLGDGPITEVSVDEETRRLKLNSAVELEMPGISDGKPLQLTMSAGGLEAELPPELGPEMVTIVLGEGLEPSPAVESSLEYLHALGYRILLDDPTANPHISQLLRFAHAVKINFGHHANPSLAKQLAVMKSTGVELVADHIETYEEFRDATEQGFTELQGTFLSKPDGFRSTKVPAGQIGALELLALLQDPDADLSDIAEVIRRDVSLSYRILKVVNSAQYSLPKPLGSIEEAVMLVGTKQIIEWVTMMSMSKVNDKPNELTKVAMVRARVCEDLARRLGRTDRQRFHVVGLFSVIEALLDIPADKTLAKLPLDPEIIEAIVSQNGILGEVLKGVIAYEEADWARSHVIGITDEAMAKAFEAATINTDASWAKIHQ
ncbi:MAG: HDOD domain-containing protein [bacterium]|nr:HDOD domain-containing protein [bacterium]